MENNSLMTIDDVVKRLNSTEGTIRKMIFNQEIPYLKIGGSIRFDQKDIEKWINDCKQWTKNSKRLAN